MKEYKCDFCKESIDTFLKMRLSHPFYKNDVRFDFCNWICLDLFLEKNRKDNERDKDPDRIEEALERKKKNEEK